MRNKITSIALSVVIAFGLWLYVVTNISQEMENTFHNIPLAWEGETVLNENGLMVTGKSHNSAALTLKGNRSDLSKLNSANITLRVDLSKIDEPGTQIPVNYSYAFPGDVPSSAVAVEEKSPAMVYVTVEERRTKEVPVEIEWIGSAPDGFMTDRENRVLDFSDIMVSGPASVADRIEKAVIEVDLTERRESIDQNFRYTLCDAEGNPVDAELITTNAQEVHLTVRIQRIKEVTLAVDVIYGGGATPDNTVVELSTGTIRLSGGEAVLEELGDEIVLGRVNLAEIAKSQTLTFPINLPEGITNLSNVAEVQASVRFSGLSTKEIVVDNFFLVNMPENLTADLITENLTVVLRGPAAELLKIQERNITITVDLSNAEAGETATFRATVDCGTEFPLVGALGPNSVTATIAEKK